MDYAKEKNLYALFVMTGDEDRAVREIAKLWRDGECTPFNPKRDQYFKHSNGGHWQKVRLFPGYVFVESTLSDEDFATMSYPLIGWSECIIKLLRYNLGSFSYAMREDERVPLVSLFNESFCIEKSTGLIAGDRVVITGGTLAHFDGKILNTNAHKKFAVIELMFMGTPRKVTVPLDIVRKLQDKDLMI